MTLQEAVLLSGLFVAFPAGIAVATGWLGVRRHRAGWRRRSWAAAGGAGALALVWWLQAVLGTIPPDALDRAGGELDPVVRTTIGCHQLARVTELRVGEGHLTFRCAQTAFGWPSIGHAAECVDGSWAVQGWKDRFLLVRCEAG